MSTLLERDSLLACLAAHRRDAAQGRGHTVLVSGEAGIGKTALLERFVAEQRGVRVLWGGCEAMATPRPLGPLHDMAMAGASRVGARLAGTGERADVFDAMLEEIGLPPAPTVVVVEDVHWADEATLDLVKFLGRRIHRMPALLLLSHRDDETSLDRLRSVLGELPAAHVTRMRVPALTASAVAELASGARAEDSVALHVATGGNAFFVTELLRQRAENAVGGETHGVPASVRDAVLARAGRLSPAALDVLQRVATVPRQVDAALCDTLLGRASNSLAAVEACLASGLLVADGRNLRFRHELARSAVEASLPATRAAQLHAQVLAALIALPADQVPLAALAHHAQRAGDAEAVLRWAPLAAREAALRGARRQAVAHCQAALRHAHRLTGAEHAELLDALVACSFELNDLPTAIAAGEQAIALWGTGDAERCSLSLSAHAMCLVRALRNTDADAASHRAITVALARPPGRALARAYATASYLRMLNRDNEAAIAWGERRLRWPSTWATSPPRRARCCRWARPRCSPTIPWARAA